MGKYFNENKNADLDVIKSKLWDALSEAKEGGPGSMEDFVQMVGLVMTRTLGPSLTDRQIRYVTSRLLDSEEKTMLGTGEGKSTGDMLLLASQALLGKELKNIPVLNVNVMKRDFQDFEQFFGNLDLNADLKEGPGGAVFTIELAPERLQQADYKGPNV